MSFLEGPRLIMRMVVIAVIVFAAMLYVRSINAQPSHPPQAAQQQSTSEAAPAGVEP